jgi:hypothetical protein
MDQIRAQALQMTITASRDNLLLAEVAADKEVGRAADSAAVALEVVAARVGREAGHRE